MRDLAGRSGCRTPTPLRLAGLTLTATDRDWTTGSGPAVQGPLLSLVMAMTGRTGHVDDLTGDGVETLRSRCR